VETKIFNIHQDLIERCRKNDQKAQFEIYKLYYKSLYNTALRILNHSAEAEDVMQESFLAAFQKIQNYSEKSTFGAWLKKIVIHKSLDALRKKKMNFCEIENDILNISEEEENEKTESEIFFEVERIKLKIKELANGYRIILSLHLFENYSHSEIAEMLNISSETVRSQFSRAKKKLLTLLNQ